MTRDIKVALIVAAADNGVIGLRGRLPWRMPSDLRTFRRLTLGKPVIMGRKTFQSIGKPLDGRDNIVVTRDPGFAPGGVEVMPGLDAALARARELASSRGVDEIMVIGGAELYRAALPVADRIYLTRVHVSPEGDATFRTPHPEIWYEVERHALDPDPRDEYAATFIVLERSSVAGGQSP